MEYLSRGAANEIVAVLNLDLKGLNILFRGKSFNSLLVTEIFDKATEKTAFWPILIQGKL